MTPDGESASRRRAKRVEVNQDGRESAFVALSGEADSRGYWVFISLWPFSRITCDPSTGIVEASMSAITEQKARSLVWNWLKIMMQSLR